MPAGPANASPNSLPEATGAEKLVIKRGNLFAVTTRLGDIAPSGARDQGFFFDDTRFLSYLRLSVSGGPAICLSSQTSPDYLSQIDLTVTNLAFGGVFNGDPVNFLHLRREQMIDSSENGLGGSFVDHFTLTNFLTRTLDFAIELEFEADMADVFEVRGARRARRGQYEPPLIEADRVVFRYRGLDGRHYATELLFHGSHLTVAKDRARFEFHLPPNESETADLWVTPGLNGHSQRCVARHFRTRADLNRAEYDRWAASCAAVETGDELFDRSVSQGLADLKALTGVVYDQPALSAGIPWYTAPFGRDSAIASIQALPFTAQLAQQTLAFMAKWQGQGDNPAKDEEPGKMPHEIRLGEMARAGEIPHTPYYGSVDATPLWLILLSEYFLWTDDRGSVQALLPAAERALGWIERSLDKKGLLTYQRRSERGLRNQGWKDSIDGICFPDGTLAEPPIALVEVQGYAIDAFRRMGQLYQRLGHPGRARYLGDRARALARQLDASFWMPESQFYALALDGHGRQVPTLTSNPGHLLWSRAIPHERAIRVADQLVSERWWTGWGIRTLAKGQPAYNPLSYHNGTVWPHDNSLIAQGFANYGLTGAAARVLEGLYAASRHFRLGRLPELFCGLGKQQGEFPVLYPVACSPQAWSSGASLQLLCAVLGLHPDAPRRVLHIRNPRLPPWLHELTLRRLRVGSAEAILHFTRTGEGTFAAAREVKGGALQLRIEVGGR